MSLAAIYATTICIQLARILGHFVWQAAALALLAVAADRLLRRAPVRVRHGVFGFLFMVLAACPVATFVLTLPREALPTPGTVRIMLLEPGETHLPWYTLWFTDPGILWRTPWLESRPNDTFFHRVVAPPALEGVPAWMRYAPLAVCVYFVGLVGALLRLGLAMRPPPGLTFGRAAMMDPLFAGMMRDLAGRAGLRRAPWVCLTPDVPVPAVYGVFRPTLLLPAVLGEAKFEQLERVVLPLLVQLKQSGYATAVCLWLAEALGFFHPGVGVLTGLLRREQVRSATERADQLGCETAAHGEALLGALSAGRAATHLPSFASRLTVAMPLGMLARWLSRRLVGAPQPAGAIVLFRSPVVPIVWTATAAVLALSLAALVRVPTAWPPSYGAVRDMHSQRFVLDSSMLMTAYAREDGKPAVTIVAVEFRERSGTLIGNVSMRSQPGTTLDRWKAVIELRDARGTVLKRHVQPCGELEFRAADSGRVAHYAFTFESFGSMRRVAYCTARVLSVNTPADAPAW